MGSEDNDRERMRDIVERLELQAFVADKIQSGMKPLIMDCLNEITNLRIDNAKFYAQAEMNARLLTENASLRAENLKLCLELDMQQATILVPSQKDDQRRIERLDAALKEALDEAASIRAENEKLRDVLKNCIAALRHAYFHGFTELYKTTADEAAAALKESGDE